MKRYVMAAAVLMVIQGGVFAQQPPAAGAQGLLTSGRVVDPAARSNMLARTGGIVTTPLSGPAIAVVNMQGKIPASAIAETVDAVTKIVRLPLKQVEKQGKDAQAVALETLKDAKVAGVVVICEEAGKPVLLHAPEDRWVILNVAPLSSGASDKGVERTQKEIWRALGFLTGTGYSVFEGCLMKPIRTPSELDAIKAHNVSPEAIQKLSRNATMQGVQMPRFTTYRKACEEGWAPMPTNSFQKAIWEEVRASKK